MFAGVVWILGSVYHASLTYLGLRSSIVLVIVHGIVVYPSASATEFFQGVDVYYFGFFFSFMFIYILTLCLLRLLLCWGNYLLCLLVCLCWAKVKDQSRIHHSGKRNREREWSGVEWESGCE